MRPSVGLSARQLDVSAWMVSRLRLESSGGGLKSGINHSPLYEAVCRRSTVSESVNRA